MDFIRKFIQEHNIILLRFNEIGKMKLDLDMT